MFCIQFNVTTNSVLSIGWIDKWHILEQLVPNRFLQMTPFSLVIYFGGPLEPLKAKKANFTIHSIY